MPPPAVERSRSTMCRMVCHCIARIQHPTSKTLLVPMTMGLGSTSWLSGVIFSGYLQEGRTDFHVSDHNGRALCSSSFLGQTEATDIPHN